ncbi:5-methyltetrahydropteroyltriglutamate--homocysteine methyltransferase [Aquisphaera giovannonii]|uniref:5-methyltetrahydropteroyltriglutamate--homocysteine methyltransferase n=1 Tax=Aquisphaera giovannonii TaxID=406548 RepID=A0A5B9W3C2_9BACT|nr:sulfurtransferase TusA family protein [Aquisphaera giovannonii]QEH34749.1 5-methyltetrahydropteroyltriglutamate--homocysteine methyltransferase [Aquisphaera giovannonii]
MSDANRDKDGPPALEPADRFDGGDMDCGSGLLLQIRRRIDPLGHGQLLELRSTEPSVSEDLPSWCRMTGNELVSAGRDPARAGWIFLISKGPFTPGSKAPPAREPAGVPGAPREAAPPERRGPRPAPPAIPPLAVMGIGSWPRPAWLLIALREWLEGRMEERAFHALADRAVAEVIVAQIGAGVDVFTDGEQRRDGYASFVGGRLANCQLIPIVDLLPYVEHPDEFARELAALDVPAQSVRHPAVFGRIARDPARPLARHELDYPRTMGDHPLKVALPGPYLLTRTMWLECVSDRVYREREELAADIVRVLREEVADLLDAGAALVQLDEPVLTEVVHGRRASGNRSFMCGALGEKRTPREELELATRLLGEVFAGFPRDRLALHVCRGNWTRDESAALAGDYRPLVGLFSSIPVGTLFLELCTPRAGEIDVLRELPDSLRIGVGVVDQKTDRIETPEEIIPRAEKAIALFGPDRVLLNPDCGFATFADSPISKFHDAQHKLQSLVVASRRLRRRHFGNRAW